MYENFGLLVDGEWRQATDGGRIGVESPVTEECVGHVPQATPEDCRQALSSSRHAFLAWAETPAWERAAVLRKTADIIRKRTPDYAQIMSTETGKPLAESKGEIGASADQFEWYAEEAKRLYGQTIPGRHRDERLSVIYQPVGPCLALSAWNFPMLLPSRKVAAALSAGCSVVARPASEAPGSCMAMGQALMEAGIPKGVFTLLTGKSTPMVRDLIESPVIRKVSLTGSVAVGKEVLALSAQGMKKVTMELGGHAPVIVYPDADPVAAAEKLAATKFRNCGQVCISPSRFYVHGAIAERFKQTFAEVANSIVVGNGLESDVQMGPMIRASTMERALSLIEDAVSRGATLLAGGSRSNKHNSGHFLQPTVLGDVSDGARIMIEEPFAPVAPIAEFSDVDEVIGRANATEFGLAAYVFTQDSSLAQHTAEKLEAGMVGVNETLLATAEAPFGGIKASGFGREGGSLGIQDYVVPKYIRHRLVQTDLPA